MIIPKKPRAFMILLSLLYSQVFAQSDLRGPSSASAGLSVIPRPFQSILHPGHFTITPQTKIVYFFSNSELEGAVNYLAGIIKTATGYRISKLDGFRMPKNNLIFLDYFRDQTLGDEGYRLDVAADRVYIRANSEAGLFYAVQTLFELLPPEVFSSKKAKGVRWRIPCVTIADKPRFPWRGMHLDVSRHFFPKDFIETYIDMLAMHKMNVFHWHLTDDQGWRIEIKRYPKLTQVGAWRVDRGDQKWGEREPQKPGEKATYGGFYTQEEIAEIVRYARERQVTIVPEIEMPAHSAAALAAYPEYSCPGGPFTVPPGGNWPIVNIFCAGNDSTFEFLQNILSEVIDLFPGKYIHIGGDEADKTEWKKCPKCQARIRANGLKDESDLQSYFIKRIEKFLLSKNRRLIGWDEILEGGLAPQATVMAWRGMQGGVEAARSGHDVVMTPTSHCYFDYYQGRQEFEPLAIGGYTPLNKVYSFEPVPDSLTPLEAAHILGAQANVWTEFIPTPAHAEYMTLPRMAAAAEVAWSPRESRNLENFVARLERQMMRYKLKGYNYAKSAYLVAITTLPDSAKGRAYVSLSTEMGSAQIRYSLDGSEPSLRSPKYALPFEINKTSVIRAVTYRDKHPAGAVTEQRVMFHKALLKPVSLKYDYDKYTGGGDFALTNGIRGTKSYDDGNWQGFEQNDLMAVVDLGDIVPITRLSSAYLENTVSWIFFPSRVEYALSEDGVNYRDVAKFENPLPLAHQEVSIKEFSQEVSLVKARYVRVVAKNVGVCPEWHAGKGGKAWLFVDEIVVE